MDFALLIFLLVPAYAIGAFPTAVWLSRFWFNDDIRNYGSGNAGSTNMYRNFGFWPGLLVQIIDVGKGYVAAMLPRLLYSRYEVDSDDMVFWKLALGGAAVLGHIYPIWAEFRGGKGVNTILGMMLAIHAWAAGIGILTFLIVLFSFRYVSLASMMAVFVMPVHISIYGYLYTEVPDKRHIIISLLLALLVVYTHRSNIRRLLEHTERRVRFRRQTSHMTT